MNIGNGYHLTYCSNIHPGEEWEKVFANLKSHIPALKAKLAPDKSFGIGLRLSDVASRELIKNDTLAEFKSWLKTNDAYVFTINGFPYGGFHRQVVKDDVHKPDWTTQQRVDYTLRLCNILAELLPAGMDGGISTSPLSYKPWLKGDKNLIESAFKKGCVHYAMVANEMARIKRETGKVLHLDIEPEPDGLIENTREVKAFYAEWLLPEGVRYLTTTFKISESESEQILRTHIQLCYDVCHFAVAYENPRIVFEELQKAGIKVGKIQISAALKAALSENIKERARVAEKLTPFAESTYLHQVIERDGKGNLTQYTDLSIALGHINKPEAREWRTHFHVPIFLNDYQMLQSTQEDIVNVLKILKQHIFTTNLEIETYTWDVLPPDMKLGIQASIQREMEWVLHQMN